MRRLLVAALLMLAPPAAAAEPPAALIEATEAAAVRCSGLGGQPAILDGYRVTRDLNGDGSDDFLTDLARLECGGAWGAFCGSSGCPVTAWLSEPGGGYARFEIGRLLGFDLRDGEPLPALVARYAAPSCAGQGLDECTRTWTFASNSPEMPPIDPQPQAAEPPEPATPGPQVAAEEAPEPEAPEPDVPQPEAPEPAAPPAFPAPEEAGWTLRRVPGSSPVALGAGVGNVVSLAAFCLSGEPFLAVSFRERPEGDRATLAFAFGDGTVEAAADHEATAGGAFVVALSDSPLAAGLAGRDREVALSVDAVAEGTLSLAGSTRAIRGALEPCGGP